MLMCVRLQLQGQKVDLMTSFGYEKESLGHLHRWYLYRKYNTLKSVLQIVTVEFGKYVGC